MDENKNPEVKDEVLETTPSNEEVTKAEETKTPEVQETKEENKVVETVKEEVSKKAEEVKTAVEENKEKTVEKFTEVINNNKKKGKTLRNILLCLCVLLIVVVAVLVCLQKILVSNGDLALAVYKKESDVANKATMEFEVKGEPKTDTLVNFLLTTTKGKLDLVAIEGKELAIELDAKKYDKSYLNVKTKVEGKELFVEIANGENPIVVKYSNEGIAKLLELTKKDSEKAKKLLNTKTVKNILEETKKYINENSTRKDGLFETKLVVRVNPEKMEPIFNAYKNGKDDEEFLTLMAENSLDVYTQLNLQDTAEALTLDELKAELKKELEEATFPEVKKLAENETLATVEFDINLLNTKLRKVTTESAEVKIVSTFSKVDTSNINVNTAKAKEVDEETYPAAIQLGVQSLLVSDSIYDMLKGITTDEKATSKIQTEANQMVRMMEFLKANYDAQTGQPINTTATESELAE